MSRDVRDISDHPPCDSPGPLLHGQIAAIAATRELTVVTANVADFRRFRGVTVVDWSR